MKLIVVAGPAGAGKTTWALNTALGVEEWGVVHSDNFLGIPRDERPQKVATVVKNMLQRHDVVLEGVEALRAVSKGGLEAYVTRVVWIDGPQKPGTAGLTTQQRLYLQKMQGRIPAVEIVKRNA